MGEGSRGLGKNQRGLRVGCCEMVGDYYKDSSVEENLNLLLRLTRVEVSIDSETLKGQGSLKGFFKGTSAGDFRSKSLATIGCVRRFKGYTRKCTLESSTKTLRDPDVKGELSRFKLKTKYRGSRRINTWGPGARTKQCSQRES